MLSMLNVTSMRLLVKTILWQAAHVYTIIWWKEMFWVSGEIIEKNGEDLENEALPSLSLAV